VALVKQTHSADGDSQAAFKGVSDSGRSKLSFEIHFCCIEWQKHQPSERLEVGSFVVIINYPCDACAMNDQHNVALWLMDFCEQLRKTSCCYIEQQTKRSGLLG
jgi:hypothetical protein